LIVLCAINPAFDSWRSVCKRLNFRDIHLSLSHNWISNHLLSRYDSSHSECRLLVALTFNTKENGQIIPGSTSCLTSYRVLCDPCWWTIWSWGIIRNRIKSK
jgi:hypothetical protein